MATLLPSVYRDGTATVAANGVAVTGQGTMWLNTILPGDFFGTHKGSPNRILAINSNTSLTLAYPWLGGAQATAAYEIMYQSDNARMLEAARQLLEKLSNGNVDALAGLVGGADKLPYFNGLGTMAQADLTAFARSNVINKADRATLLATTTGIGVSENLQKASRVATDLNNEFIGGWVSGVVGATANLPPNGGDYVIVFTAPWTDGAACTQTAYMYGSPFRVWKRSRNEAGTWFPWVAQAGSVLGQVAQVAGVPSGSLFETASNASGRYLRLADGTQYCWISKLFTGSGSGIRLQNIGYPAAFIAEPVLTGAPRSFGNAFTFIGPYNASPPGTVAANDVAINVTAGGAGNVEANIFLVGRWF